MARSYPNNDFNQFLNSGGNIADNVQLTDSTLGFFGAVPVSQPAANADTSGALLAALETEINELKQLLRDVGLMAT